MQPLYLYLTTTYTKPNPTKPNQYLMALILLNRFCNGLALQFLLWSKSCVFSRLVYDQSAFTLNRFLLPSLSDLLPSMKRKTQQILSFQYSKLRHTPVPLHSSNQIFIHLVGMRYIISSSEAQVWIDGPYQESEATHLLISKPSWVKSEEKHKLGESRKIFVFSGQGAKSCWYTKEK